MRRLWPSIAFLVWAAPVWALDVPVRSGEHGAFTRLAMPLPADVTWTVGRTDTGYGVRLDDADTEFDLASVFARIGRNRIAGLRSAEDGTLRIDLGCDCHLIAYRFRDQWLVLDVRDGPAAPDSPFEDPFVETEVASNETVPTRPAPAMRLPLIFDHPAVGQGSEMRTASAVPSPSAQPQSDLPPEDHRADPSAKPHVPDPFDVAPGLDVASEESEAALAETIARAVSQGLLSPSDGQPHSSTAPEQPEPHREDIAPAETVAAPPIVSDQTDGMPDEQAAHLWPGITAETSIDRERPAAQGAPGTLEDTGACLPESYFAVGDWGDDRDFPTQIAERRAALTAEFDLVPEGAPLALARTYIFFGFGREAKRALQMDGVGSQERSVLLALAALVDGEQAPFPILDSQLECAGPGVLWALLSVDGRTKGSPIDTNSIRRAFRDLPVALQGHIGNRLSEALVAAGETEVARLILERSEPAVTGATPEAEMARAEIAVADQDHAGARTALDEAVQSDIRMPPEAILRLFELSHADRAPVEESVFLLSEAYRFENRGTRLAVDLAVAEMRARLDLGQFDVAAGLLDTVAHDIPTAELRDLTSEAALALARDASDLDFLRLSLSRLSAGLLPDAEHALARRLLDLGFPDRARSLILSGTDREFAEERRYLRAESAIALGRPEDAIEELSGMSGETAARLRTHALAALGDYGAALSAGAALPKSEDLTETAWRAGAWAQLEGSDEAVLRDAAGAMANRPDADTAVLPSLSAGRDALTASEGSREIIDRLLQRFPTEPNP
ncbi:hypothetical protein EU803_10245 [Loktanella sp. IMCC34160]|uniref:hypothetical protein n=1 Tax=Loktanella sp. IMCC34160 TaxID=2510646 RepID=UPI00101C2908|nr:hypothetical protein [Loktanella sp. IMCC34160]RYG91462.1 hypothetical protein EU803_10245 [Loktanella sp. IMCC34160]